MNIQENKNNIRNFDPNQDLKIINTTEITEIKNQLSKIDQRAAVFLDIDDTIITPSSSIFRAQSPFKNYIDELKDNRHSIPNFEKILSEWRLKRQSLLVTCLWPSIIQDLHQRQIRTYALTQMAAGKMGDIKSAEEWRYQELISKGIRFSPTFNGKEKQLILSDEKASLEQSALFYRGFFLTGPFSKGQVIQQYFTVHRPEQVIFVDDREAQLQNVYQACLDASVPYLGIHYRGAENLTGMPDPALFEIQKQKLLENFEWLEDEEAAKLLKK